MTLLGPKAYLRRFGRSIKSEPVIDEMEILHVNPKYANVRNSSERELRVSLKNLVPYSSTAIQLPSMLVCVPDEEARAEVNKNLVPILNILANSVPVKAFKVIYLGVLQEPIKELLKYLTLMNEIVVNQGYLSVCSVCVLCFLIVYCIFVGGVKKVKIVVCIAFYFVQVLFSCCSVKILIGLKLLHLRFLIARVTCNCSF